MLSRKRSSSPSKVDALVDVAGSSALFDYGLAETLFGIQSNKQKQTKGERAYATVRRAIVTHELPAGIPLDESMLFDHFQLGRTPLREALKRLSYEGLLNWPPHQAPIVHEVAISELPHLYETRRILETQVVRLAATRATPEDIEWISMRREALVSACDAHRVYESVELDYALHATIAQATQNPFLAEASNFLNLKSLRVWFRAFDRLGLSLIDQLHKPLVEALSRHDPHEATRILKNHLDNSLQNQQLLLAHRTSQTEPNQLYGP